MQYDNAEVCWIKEVNGNHKVLCCFQLNIMCMLTLHIITGDGTSVHTFYNILPRQICIPRVVSMWI